MTSRPSRHSRERGERTHAVLRVVSALVPAMLAAAHTVNVPDAAHDEGTIRAVGLGWTGVWRGADALVSSVAMLLPIGTRAMRAGLASAIAAGVAGAIVYSLARRLLAACAALPRLGAYVAALAAMTATIGAPWQLEAGTPGGSALGALFALAPMALLASTSARVDKLPMAAALVGVALGYEPLVGLIAFASSTAFVGVSWTIARPYHDGSKTRIALASLALAAIGAAPAIVQWGRATLLHDLNAVSPFAASMGEAGASPPTTPGAFAQSVLGWIVVTVALGGAALAIVVPRARAIAAGLFAIAAIGIGSTLLGAPAGPSRYSAPALAAIAATSALAAVAMQAIVRVVAASKLPLAHASAALVVLFELTIPVHALDESLARAFERTREPAAEWEEIAWGPLPAGSVLMLNDPRTVRRVLAERAAGTLRGDLMLVPTFDLNGAMARAALGREPKLAAFWRDIALYGAPEEFALSSIASARPLALVFDARWNRALARHLVPAGLVTRFEPEPRGASDRRRALDGFVPRRNQLIRSTVETRDPELVDATALLLRARAIALAACGDKDDVVVRVIDDLHAFAPIDMVADKLARRAARAKGPVDVRDLAP